MASVRLYCDCKINKIGIATVDLYLLSWRLIDQILKKQAKCKHCGALLKYVED